MKIYRVNLTATNCKYEIGVNGFPILIETEGYQTNTHYNINQLISGDHFGLQIKLLPTGGQDMLGENVEFKIVVAYHENGSEDETPVFEYQYDPLKKSAEVNENKLLQLEKIEYIPVWHRAEKIDFDKRVSDLMNYYQKIWNLFNAKDIESIMKSFEIREQTYAYSYGESIENRIKETRSIYESYFKDSNYDLFPIIPKYFKPHLYGFGKILCLEQENGFGPIFYVNKQKTQCRYIPFYFSQLNNELIITL